MGFLLKRTLLAALLAIPGLSVAQSPTDSVVAPLLPDITVTAERRPVGRAVVPVRVVEGEAIRTRASYDLTALLRDIPGIQLDPMVGSGQGVSMQGLGSDRILILLDGTPMPGRISNEFDLTRIDPALLERVEVVEGPQSTLYGSSALGGVVNLISRAPRDGRVELRSQGGSFGHFDMGARASGSVAGWRTSVDLGRRSVDVVPGLADGTGGTAERWTGMLRAVGAVGGGALDLRVMHLREDQEYLTGAGVSARESLNRNIQTDALARWSRGGREVRAHVGSYDHTLRSRVLSSGSVADEPQVQSIADVEALQRTTVGTAPLVFGVRGEYERIRSDRVADGTRRNLSLAGYGSAEFPLSRTVRASAGMRVTAAEVWGTNVAPRIGLAWEPGVVYATVAAARGFRAPSFLEQFADYVNTGRGNYAIRGNVDLQPERSWNVTAEVGARGRAGRGYVRGYRNELRDFIETTQVGAEGALPVFSYRNVGEARTQGVEVGGDRRVGIAQLTASYAWLDAEDTRTGAAILGRAEHTVRAALALRPGRWFAEGEFVRASATPVGTDRSTGALLVQGASPRVNLRAGASVSPGLQLTAGVDNVGDVIPERAVAGFGRRWFAGLTWGGEL
jgi:outer membrane receptor for ferrienterochelin and colicins